MLRTIGKSVVGLLLAKAAVGLDRSRSAATEQEQAAAVLVRSLRRLCWDAPGDRAAHREEAIAAAERYVDLARAKGRAWPRRPRRSAVVAASSAYRLAVEAAHARDCRSAAQAALRLLIQAHPDLECELPPGLLDPRAALVAGAGSDEDSEFT